VQYASGDYTNLLRAQGIAISMSRKANPYDNAMAESFMKTLKYEEVYRENCTMRHATCVCKWRWIVWQCAGRQRCHSCLGSMSSTATSARSVTMRCRFWLRSDCPGLR
jgi:transposase InsO family protein